MGCLLFDDTLGVFTVWPMFKVDILLLMEDLSAFLYALRLLDIVVRYLRLSSEISVKIKFIFKFQYLFDKNSFIFYKSTYFMFWSIFFKSSAGYNQRNKYK